MRFGLYGGSFDPVHLGHLLVAQAAWEELGLNKLVFIPAAQSPFKPHRQLAPAAARLKLLRLALAGWQNCDIDTQELDRGGISYTVDTVRTYRSRFPGAELFYLIGADHVPHLTKWRDAAALATLVHFVIIPRPGEAPVDAPPGFSVSRLKGFPLGVSSSQIRERIQCGQPVELLTGSAVAEAIRNNGLYL